MLCDEMCVCLFTYMCVCLYMFHLLCNIGGCKVFRETCIFVGIEWYFGNIKSHPSPSSILSLGLVGRMCTLKPVSQSTLQSNSYYISGMLHHIVPRSSPMVLNEQL